MRGVNGQGAVRGDRFLPVLTIILVIVVEVEIPEVVGAEHTAWHVMLDLADAHQVDERTRRRRPDPSSRLASRTDPADRQAVRHSGPQVGSVT